MEIFQRLNRTFYALSGIEKISTEYASSEFMLFAKYLINEIKFDNNEEEEYPLQFDPNIPLSFIEWTKTSKVKYFNKLILEEGIFSPYELTRQIHLNFTLNIISTYLNDFYNRNEFIDKNISNNQFKDIKDLKNLDISIDENGSKIKIKTNK